MKAYTPKRDLYRYTCFRESVEEPLKPTNNTVQILACRDFGIDLKEFYEDYWIPLKLRSVEGIEATSPEAVLEHSSDICLILGNTGAGKTTWQLKAVFDCVHNSSPELAEYVPVWVDCSTDMDDLPFSPLSESHFLARVAKTAGLPLNPESIDYIREILQQKLPILFLVDLNNTPPGQRIPLVKSIQTHVDGWAKYENRKMIIAYRSQSHLAGDRTYKNLSNIPGISIWNVQPLELNQAEKYYQEHKQSNQSGQEFVNVTDFIVRYRNLIETPLLLHLLTVTEFSETESSEKIETLGQFYEKVVYQWLEREEEKGHWKYCNNEDDTSAIPIAHNLLAELALALIERDQLTFTRDDLFNILRPASGKKWFPKDVFEENIFNEIIDKTILGQRGQASLAFIHDSFSYFFAAYRLRYQWYKNPSQTFLTEFRERVLKFPYRWMTPIIFLGGLNCDYDALTNACLIESENGSKAQFLLLAANFVANTPDGSISDEVFDEFTERLLEFHQTDQTGWRLQAIAGLGSRAIDLILEKHYPRTINRKGLLALAKQNNLLFNDAIRLLETLFEPSEERKIAKAAFYLLKTVGRSYRQVIQHVAAQLEASEKNESHQEKPNPINQDDIEQTTTDILGKLCQETPEATQEILPFVNDYKNPDRCRIAMHSLGQSQALPDVVVPALTESFVDGALKVVREEIDQEIPPVAGEQLHEYIELPNLSDENMLDLASCVASLLPPINEEIQSHAEILEDAVQILAHIGVTKREIISDEMTDELIACLSAEAPNVRAAAAHALGELRKEEAVGQLVEAINDEDDDTAENAAEALGRIEQASPLVLNALIDALQSHHSVVVQVVAAEALGKLKSIDTEMNRQIRTLLAGVVTAGDSRAATAEPTDAVIEMAIGALGERGTWDDGATKQLITFLEQYQESALRQRVIEELGELEQFDYVCQALEDPDADVIHTALQVLKSIDSPNQQIQTKVINILKNPNQFDSFVRQQAVETLREWQDVDGQIATALSDALIDSSPIIRRAAADAFSEWNLANIISEKIIPNLVNALTRSEEEPTEKEDVATGSVDFWEPTLQNDARASAAKALFHIGSFNSQAIVELVKSLMHPLRPVALAAISVLEQISTATSEIISGLKESLNVEDPLVQIRAAQKLVWLGDDNPQAIAILLNAVRSDREEADDETGSEQIRVQAIEALSSLQQPTSHDEEMIFTILDRLQNEAENPAVRQAAAQFFVDMKDTRPANKEDLINALINVLPQEFDRSIVETVVEALVRLETQIMIQRFEAIQCQYPDVISKKREQLLSDDT